MSIHPISPARMASPGGGDLQLPRPPGVIRRFLAAHPMFVDAAIAGSYLVPTLIAGVTDMIADPSGQLLVSLVLSTIAGTALFWRRRHPQIVFAIALAYMVMATFLTQHVDAIPALFALYAITVYRSTRASWIGFAVFSAIAAGAITLSFALGRVATAGAIDLNVDSASLLNGTTLEVIVVVLHALFWVLVGNTVGGRRRYLLALLDRAQQLARERDQQAAIAAAAERSRIAREMHDIVSHSLTVMITLADGSVRIASDSPERSVEAMRKVAEAGRHALGDMRRLLDVLRATDADAEEREPQPGVSELGALVKRFRAAGLPVRISMTGLPPSDTGQQLTVFRIVQEALTNALRYAASASVVDVTLLFSTDSIVITVEDDAHVDGAPGQGSGQGLLGLRERVGLYGGTLEAGPRPTGGWHLRAAFDTIASPSQEAS